MEINADRSSEATDRWENVTFNGAGGEYFKIWIVNLFLSILTIGIYSAWAKVRTRRYFYGNTMLDGSSFEYHATPIMILKGRLIAMAFLLVTIFSGYIHPYLEVVFFVLLALLAPFVIWRSLIFNAKMSSYRNVRFGYYGKMSSFYLYLLALPILPLLIAGAVIGIQYLMGGLDAAQFADSDEASPIGAVFGVTIGIAIFAVYLLIPYIQKSLNTIYLNGHKFGQGQFRARLDAWSYYKIYIKIILLSILIYVIVIGGMLAIMSLTGIVSDLGGLIKAGESAVPTGPGLFSSILIIVPFVAVGVWFKAYANTRFRNYSLSKLKLDSTATFRSRMKVWELFWIQFSNLLLLVFSIGLAYPWTLVRLTRYKLSTLRVHIYGNIDQYVTQMQARQSALGEEIGEAFDLDLDLGI